jgi:hypothetical protein
VPLLHRPKVSRIASGHERESTPCRGAAPDGPIHDDRERAIDPSPACGGGRVLSGPCRRRRGSPGARPRPWSRRRCP